MTDYLKVDYISSQNMIIFRLDSRSFINFKQYNLQYFNFNFSKDIIFRYIYNTIEKCFGFMI